MDFCPNNIDRLINNAEYNILGDVKKLYKHFIERFNRMFIRSECDIGVFSLGVLCVRETRVQIQSFKKKKKKIQKFYGLLVKSFIIILALKLSNLSDFELKG